MFLLLAGLARLGSLVHLLLCSFVLPGCLFAGLFACLLVCSLARLLVPGCVRCGWLLARLLASLLARLVT